MLGNLGASDGGMEIQDDDHVLQFCFRTRLSISPQGTVVVSYSGNTSGSNH
jgi:hypothetical protein